MKLSPIYVCDKCGERYQLDNHVNGEHSFFGVTCGGTLIPHYSLTDLERFISERLSRFKYQQKTAKTIETETVISGRLEELDQILKHLKEAV